MRTSRSSCSTCVGAIAARTRTALPSHTESIESAQVGAFFHGARGHTCASQGAHLPLPLRLPMSHSRRGGFRVPFRSRAPRPTSRPPSSPPARITATCPPNPETPSWAASHKGMRLSVCHELRSHTPHAIPLILAARSWLLLSASRSFKRLSSFLPLVVPYLHAAEYTHRLSLSSSLLFAG